MSQRRLRPIEPANPPPEEPGGPSVPTRGRSITRNARSNATAACLACKAKRRKCSGPPGPCNACIASKTDCVFREDLDGRRKEAIKRKLEEGTEHHRDLLRALLRSVRSSDENEAQHLIRLIRDDAPLSTINSVIDESVRKLRENSPQTEATIDGLLRLRAEAASLAEQTPPNRPRRKTMSVEQMTDEPLFQLTARPWTTVTDDDYLVSHLVSLYFTWWNTFMHPLHEPFLVDAMAAGDTTSPLCSSFLVNALLALSCSYSDLPGAFSDPDDPDTWGEHFYDEARRLWDREEGRAP
ncbi:Fungal Zn2-Cys6 binuclear cluster domain-containing protein [Cladophialophora immunda]|nr:Fungal Zn2-Cys6 binuclear cluster domain-containing protein [Cladophialophora immunda]